MNSRRLWIALPALGGVALLTGTLALSLARAQPAPPVEEKAIDFEPIPAADEKATPPAAAEWQSSTRVAITRRGPRAKNCRMYRLREWLKIHCDGQTTAVGLMGGTAAGTSFALPQAREGEPAPTSAEVFFPMKQGDRRVFELFSYGPAYGGSMISPGLVVQEHWISGEPAPVVVIR